MEKLKVLVVDDEPGIRSGIVRILKNYSVGYPFMDEDFHFEIIEAETGEKALEILKTKAVDIALLDNKLPGIDGIEVLEYINNNAIPVQVMMITSYASMELAVKATNNGAYNFMPKPFTPQELKAAIESITKNLILKRMTQKMNTEGKQIRFQFLSVLSHELKSPLNAIEGYLKIMDEKQVGNNIEDYEVMINRSMERIKGMRTLIMDLLDLTKLESGKNVRELKTIDLSELARISVDTIEPLAIQRNVKIHLNIDKHLYFNSDSTDMEIIFNNLISNAVKYNKEDGEVCISLTQSNNFVELKVEDSGIGMDAEDLDKLFQEFVRIRNAKTKAITGSGLGLSIVKKLVQLYDGKITVESEPDKGSMFTVQLPIN